MLIPANKEQITAYQEFAYVLSQDFTTSSFPTYLDGIKTKEDFLKIIQDYLTEKYPNSEILLYSEDGVVLGWIHYYWLEADPYIGFEVFNVKKNVEKAIDAFLDYCNSRFNGYQIHFGFPAENRDALSHLEEIGFTKAEESDVYTLHFAEYRPLAEDPNIVLVDESNWHDFKKLHDKHADMYWNSDRLHQALFKKTSHEWILYLYYRNNQAIGNIYFTYVGDMMEVFGMDIDEQKDILKPLLIKALNRTKADGIKYMTFFAEAEESETAKDLGLTYITQYTLYRNRE